MPVEQTATGIEEGLIRRVADGDERALGTLYDRYAEKLYGLALSVVKSEADADEVLEDAFLQVWRTAGSFDPDRGTVSSWLSVIVRSRAMDRVRARKRRRKALERSAEADTEGLAAPRSDDPPSPDERSERAELRERLDRLLAAIPEEQRRVIELAYFDGLTQREIADVTGIPLGTVKSRVRAGMRKLREMSDAGRGELP